MADNLVDSFEDEKKIAKAESAAEWKVGKWHKKRTVEAAVAKPRRVLARFATFVVPPAAGPSFAQPLTFRSFLQAPGSFTRG